MRKKGKSAEQKLKEFLAKQSKKSCYNCGYYKGGYCNDLDCRVSPDDPICSDENYYA